MQSAPSLSRRSSASIAKENKSPASQVRVDQLVDDFIKQAQDQQQVFDEPQARKLLTAWLTGIESTHTLDLLHCREEEQDCLILFSEQLRQFAEDRGGLTSIHLPDSALKAGNHEFLVCVKDVGPRAEFVVPVPDTGDMDLLSLKSRAIRLQSNANRQDDLVVTLNDWKQLTHPRVANSQVRALPVPLGDPRVPDGEDAIDVPTVLRYRVTIPATDVTPASQAQPSQALAAAHGLAERAPVRDNMSDQKASASAARPAKPEPPPRIVDGQWDLSNCPIGALARTLDDFTHGPHFQKQIKVRLPPSLTSFKGLEVPLQRIEATVVLSVPRSAIERLDVSRIDMLKVEIQSSKPDRYTPLQIVCHTPGNVTYDGKKLSEWHRPLGEWDWYGTDRYGTPVKPEDDRFMYRIPAGRVKDAPKQADAEKEFERFLVKAQKVIAQRNGLSPDHPNFHARLDPGTLRYAFLETVLAAPKGVPRHIDLRKYPPNVREIAGFDVAEIESAFLASVRAVCRVAAGGIRYPNAEPAPRSSPVKVPDRKQEVAAGATSKLSADGFHDVLVPGAFDEIMKNGVLDLQAHLRFADASNSRFLPVTRPLERLTRSPQFAEFSKHIKSIRLPRTMSSTRDIGESLRAFDAIRTKVVATAPTEGISALDLRELGELHIDIRGLSSRRMPLDVLVDDRRRITIDGISLSTAAQRRGYAGPWTRKTIEPYAEALHIPERVQTGSPKKEAMGASFNQLWADILKQRIATKDDTSFRRQLFQVFAHTVLSAKPEAEQPKAQQPEAEQIKLSPLDWRDYERGEVIVSRLASDPKLEKLFRTWVRVATDGRTFGENLTPPAKDAKSEIERERPHDAKHVEADDEQGPRSRGARRMLRFDDKTAAQLRNQGVSSRGLADGARKLAYVEALFNHGVLDQAAGLTGRDDDPAKDAVATLKAVVSFLSAAEQSPDGFDELYDAHFNPHAAGALSNIGADAQKALADQYHRDELDPRKVREALSLAVFDVFAPIDRTPADKQQALIQLALGQSAHGALRDAALVILDSKSAQPAGFQTPIRGGPFPAPALLEPWEDAQRPDSKTWTSLANTVVWKELALYELLKRTDRALDVSALEKSYNPAFVEARDALMRWARINPAASRDEAFAIFESIAAPLVSAVESKMQREQDISQPGNPEFQFASDVSMIRARGPQQFDWADATSKLFLLTGIRYTRGFAAGELTQRTKPLAILADTIQRSNKPSAVRPHCELAVHLLQPANLRGHDRETRAAELVGKLQSNPQVSQIQLLRHLDLLEFGAIPHSSESHEATEASFIFFNLPFKEQTFERFMLLYKEWHEERLDRPATNLNGPVRELLAAIAAGGKELFDPEIAMNALWLAVRELIPELPTISDDELLQHGEAMNRALAAPSSTERAREFALRSLRHSPDRAAVLADFEKIALSPRRLQSVARRVLQLDGPASPPDSKQRVESPGEPSPNVSPQRPESKSIDSRPASPSSAGPDDQDPLWPGNSDLERPAWLNPGNNDDLPPKDGGPWSKIRHLVASSPFVKRNPEAARFFKACAEFFANDSVGRPEFGRLLRTIQNTKDRDLRRAYERLLPLYLTWHEDAVQAKDPEVMAVLILEGIIKAADKRAH